MMADNSLELLEDFSAMGYVDENLLDNFLEFDFDFSEDAMLCATSPRKRKMPDNTAKASEVPSALTRASSSSSLSVPEESNLTRKKSRKTTEKTVVEQQIEYYTKPIYAFPSFDKSDALLYLPNTLSKYMNTGDVPALSKLLLSHCDKRCVVNFPKFSSETNVRKLVQIFDKMFDVHPDCVTLACAHQTKVEGNQISSSLFLKFTDIKMVQDVIRPSLQDPVLCVIFGSTREQRMQRQLIGAQSPEEETQIRTLGQTDKDILINVHVKLVLTIDEKTKKVCKFGVHWQSTSMSEIDKRP